MLRRAPGLAVLTSASACLLAACNVQLSTKAEARDQWQRHYTLADGGTLEIRNTNGVIHVDTTDGDSVEVSADRIVQASTDQAAKDGLAGFDIKESVDPKHVVIDSSNRGGMNLMINMSRRVEYHVRAPIGANLTLASTNGDINLAGPRLTGAFRAEATNGRIRASGLENSAHASTTNGTITLDVAAVGDAGISCQTTNGAITLTVPPTLNARLSARVTNGGISQQGLPFVVAEQSRRRLDGTFGTGGPTITLETTNGAIQIKAGNSKLGIQNSK